MSAGDLRAPACRTDGFDFGDLVLDPRTRARATYLLRYARGREFIFDLDELNRSA